jgi:hypothetical protein
MGQAACGRTRMSPTGCLQKNLRDNEISTGQLRI